MKVTDPMKQLDGFTRSYCEAMLWSSNDESTPEGGEPIDNSKTIIDIAPEAMEKIIAECKQFQEENAELIEQAAELGEYADGRYTPDERAGHDFWLTRVGHGCGFLDRGLGEVGEKLTEATREYSAWINPYIGDDGQVYLDG